MACCGGRSDAASIAARREEDAKQARIQSGVSDINSIFSGFDTPFYQKRQQDYVNYALPQFGRQLGDASRNLTYSLADRGLERSSAQRKASSDLGYQAGVQKQGIIDTGAQQSNDLRKSVEQQRSNLIGQLQISADPTTSSQMALSSAQNLSLPSTFAPLGNLFTNYAKTYALNQTAKAYQQAGFGGTNPLGGASYSLS